MSKPSKKPKNRYELAYHSVLNTLPVWKRLEVLEASKTKRYDDRQLTEFANAVCELAESDKEILLTT